MGQRRTPGFTCGRLRRSSVVSAVDSWAAIRRAFLTPRLTCGCLRQSSVVSAVSAWTAFAGHIFPPRLEPNGSNPGGGNTWDSILERRRPDSNRGIKALQLCRGFCAQLHIVVFLCSKAVSDEIRFADLRARFAGFFRPTFPSTFPKRGRSGAVHDWNNLGSQCGELRLIRPLLVQSPPHFSQFPPPFAAFRDTIGTQYPKTATSERWVWASAPLPPVTNRARPRLIYRELVNIS